MWVGESADTVSTNGNAPSLRLFALNEIAICAVEVQTAVDALDSVDARIYRIMDRNDVPELAGILIICELIDVAAVLF